MTAAVQRRVAWVLAAALVCSYAYFYQAGGWNQNSRFALVRAIVEQGTLTIDETGFVNGEPVTGDIARHDGHAYSDKAPGLALTAVPVVAALRPLIDRPRSARGIARLSYLTTVVISAGATVGAAVLLFFVALSLGASGAAATFAALVFGLGSPAFAYATLFYGHALATCCLAAAFAAATALASHSGRRRDIILSLVVGIGGGWATVTEYPSVIPAAAIACLAVWHSRLDHPRLVRVLAYVSIGALACAAALAWFNAASFGSPVRIGYQSEVGFEGMQEGFFGLTSPSRGPLQELLFGSFRGLFFYAPVLAAACVGLLWLIRSRASRAPGVTAATIAVYYVLFNASYHYWDGGWSYGPRHMAPVVWFLALALAPVWCGVGKWLRVGLVAAAAYGGLLALMAVAVTAQPPDTYEHPLTELYLPLFLDGEVAHNWQSYLERLPMEQRDRQTHAWNLGEKAGLTGLPSLVPLIGLWLLGAIAWRRVTNGDHRARGR